MTYTPLGRRVLLHVLPEDQGTIHIPDSARSPKTSRFQVVAIGPEVNKEHYPINVGDLVQFAQQPTSMAGVDSEQKLLTVMDYDINVIVKPDEVKPEQAKADE
jgi:co-chaperonin GroES (HSP10)